MCLAIPAQLVEIGEENLGVASWSGLTKEVALDLTPDAGVGDWVLVHAGYVIQVIDPEEAKRSLELFREMDAGE